MNNVERGSVFATNITILVFDGSVTGRGIVCRDFDRHFAILIDAVVEIIKPQVISKLPYERSDLLGLFSLRSEALPMLNLKSTLTAGGIW